MSMERRSFLALLPMMPMAGVLMVTLPQKYLTMEDLVSATKHYAPGMVDHLFGESPMLSWLTTRSLVETDGKEIVETWVYGPEDAPGASD